MHQHPRKKKINILKSHFLSDSVIKLCISQKKNAEEHIVLPLVLQEIFSPASQRLEVMKSYIFHMLHTFHTEK